MTFALSLSASAAQVTILFSGTITDMNLFAGSDPNLAIGDSFSGSLSYDDEAPRTAFLPEEVGGRGPHPESSTYDLNALPASGSIRLADYTLTTPVEFRAVLIDNDIFQQDFASAAEFLFSATGPHPRSDVNLVLRGASDGEPLHGTALSGQSWDLADLPSSTIQFVFTDENGFGGFYVFGALEQLTTVPEPALAWLLGPLALCALGYRRARS